MNQALNLCSMLSAGGAPQEKQLALFAILNLGVIESIASGTMTASDAIRLIYHAENCRYARDHFQGKIADRIMSHGVQLPDLLDALSAEEAHRELRRELEIMRSLCLRILEKKKRAA